MFNKSNGNYRPILAAGGAEAFHFPPGGPGEYYPPGQTPPPGYPGGGWNQGSGYYNNQHYINRLEHQVEENTRRIRNLNNRVRRIESYLGIRADEDFDNENENIDNN